MSRVNVGINPKYLADQHLIAEHVEITMITGGLRKHNYQIKSLLPQMFCLGTGHINFFKNKILYLQKRLNNVKAEMAARGFNTSCNINLNEFPKELCNDWQPDLRDSNIIRERISWKLRTGKNYRYMRQKINDIENFIKLINESEVYRV